jgi:hypothetical protein
MEAAWIWSQLGVGGGYGVVHNDRADADTYMKIGEAGLALQVTVKGSKFWRDSSLN